MAPKKPNSMYQQSAGLGVDVFGDRAEDPSKNVQALSEAASKRQDDLLEANNKLIQAQIDSLKEVVKIRADCAHELADAESRRVNEQLALRSHFSERLEIAESKRIDAIRAVDVNAVTVASQRAGDQATALATQVSQSAEVLRNQVAQSAEALRALVATTAATQLQNQQQQNTALSNRVTAIEQAQSEGKGKQQYSDPQMIDLLAEVKALRESKASSTGVAQGVDKTWAFIIAGVTIAISATVAFVSINRAPAPPQVIYAPAPPPAPANAR